MTSQPSKQTIVIYIFANISESKGNQKMKFDQLMNIAWYIFLENWCTKFAGKLLLDSSKTSKFSISQE